VPYEPYPKRQLGAPLRSLGPAKAEQLGPSALVWALLCRPRINEDRFTYSIDGSDSATLQGSCNVAVGSRGRWPFSVEYGNVLLI